MAPAATPAAARRVVSQLQLCFHGSTPWHVGVRDDCTALWRMGQAALAAGWALTELQLTVTVAADMGMGMGMVTQPGHGGAVEGQQGGGSGSGGGSGGVGITASDLATALAGTTKHPLASATPSGHT